MKLEEVDAAILSIHKLFFSSADAQTLLEKAQELLGNPIIVASANLNTIAHSRIDEEIKDSIWQRVVNKGPASYQVFKELSDYGVVAQLAQSSTPIVVEQPALEHRWLTGALQSRNEFIGSISVLEYYQPYEDGDLEFVQALCECFSYLIVNSSGLNYLAHPHYELLLADLFNGRYYPPSVITSILNNLDGNQIPVLYVMVVRSDVEFNQYTLLPNNLFPTKELLENSHREIKGVVLKDKIALLMSLNAKKSPRSYRQIMASILEVLEQYQFSAGVSRPFSDISRVHEHYLEAARTLELATRLNKPDRIVYYNDFALDDMFDNVSEKFDLSRFYDHNLIKILDYDQAYQTNYLRDVYILIMTGNNLREAAALLNIHRNTLNYRIHKIEELFEISLVDPETAFRLNISLRMMRFAEGENFFKKYHIPR